MSKSNFKGKVKKDTEKQKSSSGGRAYLNLPRGVKLYNVEADTRRVKLDFLPYVVSDKNHPNRDDKNEIALPGSLWWRRPIMVHGNVGAENERVLCLRSVGKKCPICEYQKKRYAEGAPKEETKEYYPQDRSLFIVRPIDQDMDEEPMVWDMSDKMFLDILRDELEEDDSNEIFPDLEEGKTLQISLKWNTIGEKGKPFPEARSITFLDREPYDEKILKEVPDLDNVLNVLTYDEIFNKFFEIDAEETGKELKDVDEEKPERKKRFHKEERNEEEKEEEPPRSFRRERKVDKEEKTEKPAESERRRRGVDVEPKEEKSERRSHSQKDKCPHGYKFGVDTDKFNECDKCDLWDDCVDEKDGK